MSVEKTVESVFAFGPFRYHPARRELQDCNGPVRIGSRALQLLDVLLESPGRLHSRDELMARVWPQTVVEETSLRVHMSALRRVLGDGQQDAHYITNVPGRGYAFVGDVQASAGHLSRPDHEASTDWPIPVQRLPVLSGRLIGRGQTLAQIIELSLRERLVSVVGAGGMGKTTVGLAVAEKCQDCFEQGTAFVDLSRLSDPGLVVVELGLAHGLNLARGDSGAALESALRDRHLLILLDNCEHVIDAVAALVDRLIRACPRLHVLTTSREPLEVEGEWVFKLPPLGMPECDEQLLLADLQAYPAIQLFVERARATCDAFELSDRNAQAVRQLCEFLDGIPLAIELAAARVDSLGVHGLLQRLESAFDLLTRGRRTSLSRHRTLHAVLDWSYELLGDSEKRVLQRLSVFRSSFDLESAVTVAAGPDLPQHAVIEAVLGLCAKSLAVLERGDGEGLQHRLLYITRLFAQKQLDTAPEAAEIRLRHARLVRDKLVAMQRAGASISQYRWTSALASVLPDLRAAIDWTLTQENDLALGLEIAAESKRPYYDAGLLSEYRRHLDAALAKLASAGVDGTSIEMKLRLGETFISGNIPRGTQGQEQLFQQTLEMVARVGSVEDRIEALFGIAVGAYGQGKYQYSLLCCGEIRELSQGALAPISVAVADRMSALNLHMLGDHEQAEQLAYRVMAFNGPRIDRRFFSEVPFGVSMRIQLARIQCLRGQFLLAQKTVDEALARARDAHQFSLGQVWAVAAVPIALWSGNRTMARAWTRELMDHAEHHGLHYLGAYGHIFDALLTGRASALDLAEQQLLEQCAPLGDVFDTLRPGNATLPATFARVCEGSVAWCAPEVMRRHALAELAAQPDGEPARLRCMQALEQALALSERQGAQLWSLRILLSLARVAQLDDADYPARCNRLSELVKLLDEGSSQPDLQEARQWLRESLRPVR